MTPPELIEIGNLGCDGVTYGLVVRTPEVPDPNPCVGEYCPADVEPTHLLGQDVLEAIENLASSALDNDEFGTQELADIRKIHSLLKRELGIRPARKLASRRFTPEGNGRPLPLRPIGGYRYLATPDGIGVHAPAAAFDPDPSTAIIIIKQQSIEELISLAAAALSNGFPATALYVAKSSLWWHGSTDKAKGAILPLLIDAYTALARPQYAQLLIAKSAWVERQQQARDERLRRRSKRAAPHIE